MPAITLNSSAGRLEALHDPPEREPPAVGPRAAVVCHPYPPAGGDMHNKVVFTIAKELARAGLHAVRFNFRGTGRSEGCHDHGRGEQDDARAALELAASLVPPGPQASVLMAGFSFGSFVGPVAVLDDPRVAGLLAVAPPVNHYDYAPLEAASAPLAVIYATDDELVPADQVEAWIDACPTRPRVVAVPGATHLFHGHMKELRAAVVGFLEQLQR